jgi:hypothetical protein
VERKSRSAQRLSQASPRRANTATARSKTNWQPDTPECSLCNVSFTLLRRRHHCRACLRCVCSSCCPTALPGVLRLCVNCLTPKEQDKSPIVFASSLGAARGTLSEKGMCCLLFFCFVVSYKSAGTLTLTRRGCVMLEVFATGVSRQERVIEVGGRSLSCRSEQEAKKWMRAFSPSLVAPDETLTAGKGMVHLPGETQKTKEARVFCCCEN